MNSLEHALHYPFADTLPESGNALKVAPAIKWLRMPLPFALDHINLWLIQDVYESTKGWAIVDCGIANDATKALWEQVFAQALEGYPITRVICTHMHPDHVGLAHWLCDKWKVPLFMSMTDYTMSRLLSQETGGTGGTATAAHFARHGLTQLENVEKILSSNKLNIFYVKDKGKFLGKNGNNIKALKKIYGNIIVREG